MVSQEVHCALEKEILAGTVQGNRYRHPREGRSSDQAAGIRAVVPLQRQALVLHTLAFLEQEAGVLWDHLIQR